MQACLQAGQRVSKINEEAFEEAERHEEEMNKARMSWMPSNVTVLISCLMHT